MPVLVSCSLIVSLPFGPTRATFLKKKKGEHWNMRFRMRIIDKFERTTSMPLRSSILSLMWPMASLWMSSLRKVMCSIVSLCMVRARTIRIFEVTIGNRLHCPIWLALFTFSKKEERETIFKGKMEMFSMQVSSLESLSSSCWKGFGKSSMWNIDPCPITLFVISRLLTRSNLAESFFFKAGPNSFVQIVFKDSISGRTWEGDFPRRTRPRSRWR